MTPKKKTASRKKKTASRTKAPVTKSKAAASTTKKKTVAQKSAKKKTTLKKGTGLLPLAGIRTVLTRMNREYADATCSLRFTSPLELLIATILSAQCTDQRVNIVTESLFKKYRKPEDYAHSPEGVLEEDIRSTGFYRNKAKSLRGACARIGDEFGGKVPEEMVDLLTLPGVARKTANVVLGNAFGKSEGIVVDTHVSRLAGRLGLTVNRTPEKIEADLMKIVPRSNWTLFSHQLIQHGRRTCTARKPDCASCLFADLCPSAAFSEE